MANVKISDLPAASTPLSGTELVPIVQSGVTSQTTVDNLLNPLAETNGSSLVGYLPFGTGAVATTVQTKLRETVSVKDFGAVGDGVTDDTDAIQSAIDAVNSAGGGTIFFPTGTYLLATTTSDGTVSAHFHLTNMEDLNFVGYGATLTSSYSSATTAATLFNCNGVRRVKFEGFDIVGIFARTLNVVSQYSISAFYLRSITRDAESICIKNIRAQNVYTFLAVYGTGSSTRVRNILVENVFAYNGYYGFNFQDNGDNFTAINFRTTGFIRSYFPYGVDTHNVQYTSYNGNVFTDCLIKAYGNDTRNINVKATIIGNTSNDAKCCIESQHNPTTQPIPAKLININVQFDDSQSSGAKSLRFAYFQDTPSPVQTATSSYQLFDNVVISGYARNDFDMAVTQNVSGYLNVDNLIGNAWLKITPYSGYGLNRYTANETGVWTPALKFGGGNTGMTYASNGFYRKIGNIIHVTADITLTAKGTSTGNATLELAPFVALGNTYSIINCVAYSGASGLPASIFGYLDNANSKIILTSQSATGLGYLNDTNFTNTTRLFVSGTYMWRYD